MNKIENFINKHYQKIVLIFLVLIFVQTCGDEAKPLRKRVDTLSAKIDSLEAKSIGKKDLQIEGLKVEKRLIQATDRKLMDVNRQFEIEKEIESLQNKSK
jgi:ABC-type phosphate transport system auxiliary subunit